VVGEEIEEDSLFDDVLNSVFGCVLFFSEKHAFLQSGSSGGRRQANPSAVDWVYPMHVPGDSFTVSVDVVNVTDLFSFSLFF
jgi:hypothetical protein